MIQTWELREQRLCPVEINSEAAVWWDLSEPTPPEEQQLEAQLGLDLPTREEMMEIEATSRLYSEDGGHFMTVLVPSRTDGDDAVISPITFILIEHRLITIRYTEPRAFTTFPQRAAKADLGLGDGVSILLVLLESIVDRLADVLERAERDIDVISGHVFGSAEGTARKEAGWKTTLAEIGRKGGLTSKIRGSLATLERMVAYLGSRLAGEGTETREQLMALAADIRSLTDHAGFIDQKIIFLLDATLGMITIEQNATIKIFSVVSVIFLPPTLVASVYGMNFEFMPELSWPFGYPFAIGVMILSAMMPYLYFKRRNWL